MAKKKKAKKKIGVQGRILLIVFVLTSLVFYKVSILLLIGMLPTIAARLIDKTPDRTKVLTVGFMNFAGCFPYCFDLFTKKSGEISSLIPIISNPVNIIIMYAAAGLGYIIEWGIVGFVASLMVQRGRQRLVDIKKIQEAIVKKWGPEATGDVEVDEKGFALEADK